ncbi:unnamed protein product, partial [Hydatigera taeniaeformis]|uniref:PCM1_C domain-containing protein n=1 Tax=Hydatigena taeniaeformis TaxID=6205 RepID=A0A0R3X8V9_HYDTA
GLERKCPPTPSNRLPSSSSSSSAKSSFSDSRHLSRTPPDQSSPWRVVQTSDSQPGLPRAPPPPPSVPVEDSNYLEKRDGEDQDGSTSAANTLTQSIRASFNPLSCREATAENDLNSLLRQLEEVENTMKQLEQDDGGFTRRYSLASSSTTDPNTGCNPSPAPDAPEQVTTSSPLPLATNGHSHIINADQLNAERVARKPMPIPPSVPLRPPSPSNTDYELADDTSVAALLAPSVAICTKPTNMVLHDDDLVDEAQGEREQRNDLQRYCSMEVASPSNQTQANRFSSIDSASVRRSSLAALRPPPPPPPLPSPQSPLGSSNEVSLSDKSVSEFPELFKKLNQVVDLADRLQLNKVLYYSLENALIEVLTP